MDVFEAIRNRYSVRAYQDQPVEEAKLQRILEAAQAAPTARNRQMWKLIVVQDADIRKAIAQAAGQAFLAQAPILFAIVGLTPGEVMHCQIPVDPVDCAIVLDHIALAATAEGLGTCWIGHFDQDKCRAILQVPDTARIVELMPLGYASTRPHAKNRKPLDKLVSRDRFA